MVSRRGAPCGISYVLFGPLVETSFVALLSEHTRVYIVYSAIELYCQALQFFAGVKPGHNQVVSF